MSLANFGSQMLAEIRRIAESIVRRDGTHLRWATVTGTDPLRIRYDGETNPSIVTPQNLVAGLNVGDRVRVAKQNGQATIIGPANGHRAISDGRYALHVGDDGAPRLWADTELVYDREYAAAPNLHITPFGTIGRSTLPPPISTRGTISIPVNNTAGATTTVTFPSGMFSSAPTPFVARASAGAAKYVPYTANITATGMTIGVYAGDGSTGSHTAVVAWEVSR